MKNLKYLSLFTVAGLFFVGSTANAEEKIEQNQSDKAVIDKKDLRRTWELQLEYLRRAPSDSRKIDNYNVHVYQKFKDNGVLSWYRGFSFTRATGYNTPKTRRDRLESNGVGVGPGIMLRWTKKVSGKFHLAYDVAGSFMFYNRAHPAQGRAYGFLWRTGPRLIWQYAENDSVNLGWSISHFSNAMHTHNPGYNTMGFSLGLNHKF